MNLKVRKEKNRAFQAGLRERKRLRRQRREEHLGRSLEAATTVLDDAAECYTAAKRRRRGKMETERIYVTKMAERGHDEQTALLGLALGRSAR